MNAAGIRDFFRLIKSARPSRVVNLLYVRHLVLFSRIVRRPFAAGLPSYISIEPTSRCNLSCRECPVGRKKLERESGDLDMELFRHILDEAAPKAMYLNLYFQGEPLLHPYFCEMVGLAKKAGLYVATSTNGQLIDKNKAEQLILSGLDRLIISFDGPDEEVYQSYRQGGQWEKVLAAVKLLVEAKKQHAGRGPLIVLQCLYLKDNEKRLDEVKQIYRELGADRLEFKTLQLSNPKEYSGLIPTATKKSRYKNFNGQSYLLKRSATRACSRAFTTAVITIKGDIVPCCYDKTAGHKFGNIRQERLKTIWQGSIRKVFLQQLLTARSEITICSNCDD